MKTVSIVFISIFLIFLTSELLLVPFIKLPKPELDNNSFSYNQRHFPKMANEETYVFIGSSAFSRNIDCQLFPKNCLNLSIDGGDARIYDILIHNYLYSLNAKKVVLELSSFVFVDDYESVETMDTFLYPPSYFLKNFLLEGLTNKFKQSIKNYLDSFFLWSRLNFLSRRQRLEDWPTWVKSNLFTENILTESKAHNVFTNSYLNPNPEKVEIFKNLLIELKQRKMEVHIISEPVEYQGKIDPEVILNSPLILEIKKIAQENNIQFHERFKDWGLEDKMLDEFQHYHSQFVPWHTQTIMKMLAGESK